MVPTPTADRLTQHTFDQSLPMMLYRALDVVMPPYRDLFSQFNITEQQWRVLRVLWSNNQVTSAQLAERTLLSAPSLVGIIDRLEKKGLIQRIRSTTDRRAVYIVATGSGRALQNQTLPLVEEIQEHMRSSLSDEEWQQLENALAKISRSVADRDAVTGDTPLAISDN